MKTLRRLLAGALAAILALTSAAWAETAACPTVETSVREIKKYGNLVLDISGNALLALGYEFGDIVAVEIGGHALEMPICANYSDVDTGAPVCRVTQAENVDESSTVLALSGGDLATFLGIAERTLDEGASDYRWDYAEAYADGVTVTLSLREKGGYLNLLARHRLRMSKVREDYPDLTDEQYANFRNVATTGMGRHVLNRSSSPVNPAYNRNKEADTAVNAAGIRTVMNLADSEYVMKGYEDYASTYYSRLDVIALNLIVDFQSTSFRAGIAEGFRFFGAHQGPYLVHCTIGKDRAGFVCAVLECLMGASADEVIADYMVSYYNYYGVEPGSVIYDVIAESNICKALETAFGIADIADADLSACAEAYLLDIGMTAEEIAALKARLGTDIQ